MNSGGEIQITAKDCSPIDNAQGHEDVLNYLAHNPEEFTVLHFTNPYVKEWVPTPIVYYDFHQKTWWAGRYVGEAKFQFNQKQYRIIIRPRFGDIQLFRMLEKAFNVHFTKDEKELEQKNKYELIIKKLIAFWWVDLVAKANRHGLPRKNVVRQSKGTSIKGKINVRKSIIPLYTEKKLVSNYRNKEIDPIVAKILNAAYQVLHSDYSLSEIKLPASAKHALNQLTQQANPKTVTFSQYQSINYHPIYKHYKKVVDFSWQLIRKKFFGKQDTHQKEGMGFFIDMAEVWEIYLRSVLKESLRKYDWHLIENHTRGIYKDMSFKTSLIPDIVLEKGNKVMIWDAKYKRMHFSPQTDYDRNDMFQIHTYISYFKEYKHVVAGGLLYPLSKEFDQEKQAKHHSESLFASGNNNTQFLIDGIDLSGINYNDYKTEQAKYIDQQEEEFVERISKACHQ